MSAVRLDIDLDCVVFIHPDLWKPTGKDKWDVYSVTTKHRLTPEHPRPCFWNQIDNKVEYSFSVRYD